MSFVTDTQSPCHSNMSPYLPTFTALLDAGRLRRCIRCRVASSSPRHSYLSVGSVRSVISTGSRDRVRSGSCRAD